MNILNKFPSFEFIFKNAATSFSRFPFVLISAIVAAIAVINIPDSVFSTEYILKKIFFTSALGIPLFISIAILGEKRELSKDSVLLSRAVGLIFLILYYFSLPENIQDSSIDITRFILLNIGFHFVVAFIPFCGTKQILGFWQFNKSLFLRFLLAALYSAVMFVGLVIALAAADYLFGFDVKGIRYFQLWVIMAFVVNTWIFLNGIPRNLDNLNERLEYPGGLRVFTQYILLPLVALYFVILLTYEAKIVFTWNWPKGWVSHLVLWYSVIGILSMLLLYPLKEKAENRWIKVFSKWFYIALIPFIIMLFFAIIKRISEYGFTENRYFVLIMAIGLSIVVLYFILSRLKDIRIVPIIICCLVFFASFGPWGAFSVSKFSQQSRLEGILVKNNILIGGSIQKASDDLSFETRKEISSIVKYLNEQHGYESLSSWLSDSALNMLDTLYEYSRSKEITNLMGFELINEWEDPDDQIFHHYSPEDKSALRIMDYDYLINFNVSNMDSTDVVYDMDNYFCYARINQELTALQIRFGGIYLTDNNKVNIELTEIIAELMNSNKTDYLPIDMFNFISSSDDFDIRVVFQNISGSTTSDEFILSNLNGQLLVRKR